MAIRIVGFLCFSFIYCSAFAEQIIFPQVVIGHNWSTTFRIANLSKVENKVEITFYKSVGEPWAGLRLSYYVSGVSETDANGSFDFNIKPLSTTSWTTTFFPGDPGSSETKVGYAVISANPNLTSITGFQRFRKDPGGAVTASLDSHVSLLT